MTGYDYVTYPSPLNWCIREQGFKFKHVLQICIFKILLLLLSCHVMSLLLFYHAKISLSFRFCIVYPYNTVLYKHCKILFKNLKKKTTVLCILRREAGSFNLLVGLEKQNKTRMHANIASKKKSITFIKSYSESNLFNETAFNSVTFLGNIPIKDSLRLM